ncbi:hypothetical protein LHP98_01010 [Rhodobacter sp. Har01]|uniref:hypothetical protein n=1 Tax=Rhodobacter sp. Har01 TaxID=2883999 RepID=UPI001D07622D|nr:hypothetical protein [Rhodobacter sp. Har01]MCB6176706.1 hypothetical protein [Rhodobacter sp. Har01]
MNKLLIALFATSALSGAAFAQDMPMVKEIDVTIDMTAITNAKAADYWKAVETDLEAAILSRVTDRMAEDGSTILVDLSEVELANGFTEAAGLEDSVLKGMVHQQPDTDNSKYESYELTVDYKLAAPLLGEGFDPAASAEDAKRAYVALVDTFADQVVANLK